MANISFPARLPRNCPSKRGQPALPKQLFGDCSRYAVAPVHTRFDALEWVVWDAEHPSVTIRVLAGCDLRAEIIRQCDTLEEALEGLV